MRGFSSGVTTLYCKDSTNSRVEPDAGVMYLGRSYTKEQSELRMRMATLLAAMGHPLLPSAQGTSGLSGMSPWQLVEMTDRWEVNHFCLPMLPSMSELTERNSPVRMSSFVGSG